MRPLVRWTNDSGATAIEYALIMTGIFLVIVASVIAVGGSVTALYDRILAAWP